MCETTRYNYRNSSGTQVAQIATGAGLLHSVTINATSASPISILDGVAGGTTATIATLKASIAEQTFLFDCVFGTGLRANIQGNSDVTFCWKYTF